MPISAYEPFAQTEIGRLEQARLAAVEDRIDAELMLGHHRELLGELKALVARHPRRERLLAQLMVALYRSGRQADALDVYHRARRALDEELGLEPGTELRALQRRSSFTHDPTLDPPTHRPRIQESSPQRARGRSLLLAGGAAVFAAAIVAAIVALAGGSGISVRATANSVAVIDPARTESSPTRLSGPFREHRCGPRRRVGGQHRRPLDLEHRPGLAPGRSDPLVWRYRRWRRRRLVRVVDGRLHSRGRDAVDPTFKTAVRTVRVGDRPGVATSPNALAIGGGVVWVANDASAVVRIAEGGGSVSRIDVGDEPSGIAIGEGATWVADDFDGTVSRIDATGGVSASRSGRERAGSPSVPARSGSPTRSTTRSAHRSHYPFGKVHDPRW